MSFNSFLSNAHNVSEVEWVSNLFLSDELHQSFLSVWEHSKQLSELPNDYVNYYEILVKIVCESQSLWILEMKLVEEFWTDLKYTENWIRLANCIAWPNTIIRRDINNILVHNWETETPTYTNFWRHVVDPFGWSSKWIAPSSWYWLLWKEESLRPLNETFNKALHEKIMREVCRWVFKWVAIEKWPEEIALMPTFAIEWNFHFIQQFSHWQLLPTDVQTAKHYWINLHSLN